jgi:hypothetical protein
MWCGKHAAFTMPPVTHYHLGPNILLSSLFSNAFNLYSSLRQEPNNKWY